MLLYMSLTVCVGVQARQSGSASSGVCCTLRYLFQGMMFVSANHFSSVLGPSITTLMSPDVCIPSLVGLWTVQKCFCKRCCVLFSLQDVLHEVKQLKREVEGLQGEKGQYERKLRATKVLFKPTCITTSSNLYGQPAVTHTVYTLVPFPACTVELLLKYQGHSRAASFNSQSFHKNT